MWEELMRRLLVTVATVSAALAVLVAGFAVAQAAPAASIKISATSTVASGQSVTISGTVSPRAGGKVVQIQSKQSGKWITIARVTVRPNGYYSYQTKLVAVGKREFRLSAPATASYRTTYSRSVFTQVVPAATSVTLTAGGGTLSLGEHYRLVGKASANLAGKPLRVIIKQSTGWVALVTGQIKADGTFDLYAKTTQAGRGKELAVYVPATSTTRAAMSGSAKFDVYTWYDLHSLSVVKSGTGAPWTKNANWTALNGQAYGRSITVGYLYAWGATSSSELGGSIAYGLNKSCTAFQATVGWDDKSWKATGTVRIAGDGTTLWTKSGIAPGSASTVSVSVAGKTALSIDVTLYALENSYAGGFFVIGNPQVRCAF